MCRTVYDRNCTWVCSNWERCQYWTFRSTAWRPCMESNDWPTCATWTPPITGCGNWKITWRQCHCWSTSTCRLTASVRFPTRLDCCVIFASSVSHTTASQQYQTTVLMYSVPSRYRTCYTSVKSWYLHFAQCFRKRVQVQQVKKREKSCFWIVKNV